MPAKSFLTVPRTKTAEVITKIQASTPKIKRSQVPMLRQKIQSKMLKMRVEKQLLKLLKQIMTITKRKLKRLRLETLRWQICRALTASLPQKRPKVPNCDRIPSSWTGFRPTWTITLIKWTVHSSVLAMLVSQEGLPTPHREAANEMLTWRRSIRIKSEKLPCSTNRK